LDPGWGTSDPARRPGGQGQHPPACCGGEERRPPVGWGAVEGVEMGGGIGHPQSPAYCGDKKKMSTALVFSPSTFLILLFLRARMSWYFTF